MFLFGITKIVTVFFRFYIILVTVFFFPYVRIQILNERFCLPILYYKFMFVFVLQVSALSITLPIIFVNMYCFYLSEMASPLTPVNPIPNHGEKPERFNGTDFKRWQQKMLFYLTTLNLARFLNEDGPKLDVGETDKEKLDVVDAWNHSDFLCRNYVLNGLENTLYNVYSPLKNS